jgi:hypothetical protein
MGSSETEAGAAAEPSGDIAQLEETELQPPGPPDDVIADQPAAVPTPEPQAEPETSITSSPSADVPEPEQVEVEPPGEPREAIAEEPDAVATPPQAPAAPTPEPAPTEESAAAEAAAAPAATQVAAAPTVHVWLSSQKTREQAARGWDELRTAYPDLLGDLELTIREVDLGAEKGGTWYRVYAGPMADKNEARALCDRIKAQPPNSDCLVAAE